MLRKKSSQCQSADVDCDSACSYRWSDQVIMLASFDNDDSSCDVSENVSRTHWLDVNAKHGLWKMTEVVRVGGRSAVIRRETSTSSWTFHQCLGSFCSYNRWYLWRWWCSVTLMMSCDITYFVWYIGGHVRLWWPNCKNNVINGFAALDNPYKFVLHACSQSR